MVNSCVLVGNLTRDVALKQTNSGTSILNIGIAVNERVKNSQTGEWTDRANFFNCTCFGKRAEGLAKILHKGMKVAVSGHLRYNQWENDKGEKSSSVEIVVDDVEFMSQRDQQQPQQQQYQPQYQPQYQQPQYQPQYQQPYQQGYEGNF